MTAEYLTATRDALLIISTGSSGLFNPLVTLAGELKRRAVRRMWFACTDERRADIEAVPGDGELHFLSLGPARPEARPDDWDDETRQRMTTGSRADNFAAYVDASTDYDYLHQLYERCLDLVDEVTPALAMVDSFATFGMDAATVRGVPYVIGVSVPPSNFLPDTVPPTYPMPLSGLPLNMGPSQRAANARHRAAIARALTAPERLARNTGEADRRRAAGIRNPELRPAQYAEAAEALVAYTVFGLEYPFVTAPANLRMVGTMVPRELTPGPDGAEVRAWLDEHPSVVYIGFGTIMRPSEAQVAALVEVVARLAPEHHVLWKLPAASQRFLPPAGQLPANLRIEAWLPSQLEVLSHPHVRVCFNHAAANAIHEAAWFGVPQLVMPFWLDCYDGAVRAVDAGVALAVEHADVLDVEDIEDKLRRLLAEPSFRDRAGLWRGRLHRAGGVGAAADLVLRHLDRRAAEAATG
ncbi:glycosyltransferase [Micromonospora sp. NBC_01655]|uniref:glycosyltransferase n=1 Tax=Micromonospora sp. NBC_01655 TaxID=2975983 RepID=UPI002250C1D0|nr:glycosyltransferase [Micromonospora sp. NBC_01655]MCX4473476.1 glycosyltransferase [Micromonospora sp. NBC_01655]